MVARSRVTIGGGDPRPRCRRQPRPGRSRRTGDGTHASAAQPGVLCAAGITGVVAPRKEAMHLGVIRLPAEIGGFILVIPRCRSRTCG
jgi:hypothetical protein